MATTSVVIGFYIHRLDELAEQNAQDLRIRLAEEIKEEHTNKLKNALDQAQKSLVSINAYSPAAPSKKGAVKSRSLDGRPDHLGSGIVMSTDGLVLSLTDVVSDATQVRVETLDRREYVGDVIATDELTGLALIRINAQGLFAAAFGEPKKSNRGDPVFALSFVQHSNLTMKLGVIAGQPMPLSNERFVPFIQSDLFLSPAWSGGALVNYDGEIIGINAPRKDTDYSNQTSLSFALPIDVALGVESELINDGVVRRGRLGISAQALDTRLAEALRLPGVKGALVSWVDQSGPGGISGLLARDTILKIAEYEVEQVEDLPPLVASFKPETVANVTIIRDGSIIDVPVRFGGQNEPSKTSAINDMPAALFTTELGLSLSPLKAAELERAGLESGMVVKSAFSAAAIAGIFPGDYILSINGHALKSVEDFTRTQKPDIRDYAVQIYRDGRIFFVGVHVDPTRPAAP